MNASNMFGSDEATALGSTPTSFEIFVYTVSPAINGDTPYSFSSSPDLVAGTFLAALGGTKGEYSTPFTTTGLVGGTSGSSSGGGPGGGPASGPLVPEPSSIVLLGSALVSRNGRRAEENDPFVSSKLP